MELVSDDTHIVLKYVAAVNRKGAHLSVEELDAFWSSPRPRGAVVRHPFAENVLTSLAAYSHEVRAAEQMSAFLTRVNWIRIDSGGGVALTELGRAVLEEADRPALADPADEPMSVTIDPDDPLAYARIFHLISGRGRGLLVDPYLKFEGLADIMEISTIDRVLIGDDDSRNRLSIFARALGASATPPVVRTTERSRIHDRFFIPDEGPVYTLGSSLNSITKRPGWSRPSLTRLRL